MRVLVVTGASGGHIFPAVSFIQALKEKLKDVDTLLVLPGRSLKSGIALNDCNVRYTSTLAVSLKISSANLIAAGMFIKGIWESLIIILKFKPDIVVGFGTLESAPCLFFSWIFRIKTLIHEQNVLPGRANRLMAHFADRCAVSFLKTKDYLNINRQKLALTGNPLRKSLKIIDQVQALNLLGLSKDKFTLLVMGGSQGSRNINTGFLRAVSLLKNAGAIQVIHLAGAGSLEEIKQAYARMNISARVFDFFNQMEQAYSAADLVISRAGATTVSELIYFKLPAIISPYPYAYAHQLENAKVLKEKGCAVLIMDEELDKDIFVSALESIINNREKLKAMCSGFAELSVLKADDLLVEAALALK
ncbi:MAG: UDP-N-acetylglucosamine--N-acetylmuramyl-(pentapeptide) pyrophosphoryl-undecaprenol N-acetylglucosamine transferase [Candidatus Omnitrophica bacterium]|nr:UDP-N-acetylglucosamine--N-acetylmuramyl-(pentapeptide) pyrophosphoryl-undecaprenol N-acetylglucosamine transferase [Candidatus Omnitrophota bacterium]